MKGFFRLSLGHSECVYAGTPNSTNVQVTHAQQNFVIGPIGPNRTFVWTGDLWQQSPDGLKGHEGQFWAPLSFDAAGRIAPVKHVDSFQLWT